MKGEQKSGAGDAEGRGRFSIFVLVLLERKRRTDIQRGERGEGGEKSHITQRWRGSKRR